MKYVKELSAKHATPKGSTANIREKANITAKIIAVLKKGTFLLISGYTEVTADKHTWYGVTSSDFKIKGWVRDDVITISAASPASGTPKPQPQPKPSNSGQNNDLKEIQAKCEKALKSLVAEQKGIYEKLTQVYNILVNVKNGKLKVNGDIDLAQISIDLFHLNAQYININDRIRKKTELIKKNAANSQAISDTISAGSVLYVTELAPTFSLYSVGVVQIAAGAVIAIVAIAAITTVGLGYLLYNWIDGQIKESKTVHTSLTGILDSLKANGVSQDVIDKVTPVITTELKDTYENGKKDGENSGFFAKYKTPIMILGAGAATLLVLSFLPTAKAGISKLRGKSENNNDNNQQ